jgi:hypothetical protein
MFIELSPNGSSHLYSFCLWEKTHIANGLAIVIKQLESQLIELKKTDDFKKISEIEAEISIMQETIKEFTI